MTENITNFSILVVDDDANSRIAVIAALDPLDVNVVEATSGEDALREILRCEFAMIILDVQMKGITGFETAAIIRERDISREIPIIFLTGFENGAEQMTRGYDLGAVDYMLKPVSAESLRAKVTHHTTLLRALANEKAANAKLSQLFEERALRERENQQHARRLQAVLNAAQSGVIGLTPDGRIAIANPRARHMLGGISKATPFDWPDGIQFLDSEDLGPLDQDTNPIARAISGVLLNAETALMSRKGLEFEPRYVRLSSAVIEEGDVTDVSTVIVIDDISDQEKNRQQVERSSRLEALGQLTGGIAHDFNNLLATIQYAVQLTMYQDIPTKARAYQESVLTSIERGASLTKRLLAFAKRQPGLAESRRAGDILEEFSKLAQPTIEEHVTLEFFSGYADTETDTDLWVFCDAGQLESALLNLVINSRDAITRSGRGSKILISARGVAEIEADTTLRNEDPHSYIAKGMHAEHDADYKRDDGHAYRYVEFAVTDDGPGMTDEVKRRAIDPFFTTKDTNSGTGLGLSMVYGFVQQSDGELRIYSEENFGTTVRILIPRGTNRGEREAPVERLPQPSGTGQLIMVVEDEVALLNMITEVIGTLGYSVVPASSGFEAIKILESGEQVDLVLTDIVMPGGIGGFELASRVRDKNPAMPIVYMSGYTGFSKTEMGDVVATMIAKPSTPSELAKAIDDALGA